MRQLQPPKFVSFYGGDEFSEWASVVYHNLMRQIRNLRLQDNRIAVILQCLGAINDFESLRNSYLFGDSKYSRWFINFGIL